MRKLYCDKCEKEISQRDNYFTFDFDWIEGSHETAPGSGMFTAEMRCNPTDNYPLFTKYHILCENCGQKLLEDLKVLLEKFDAN